MTVKQLSPNHYEVWRDGECIAHVAYPSPHVMAAMKGMI